MLTPPTCVAVISLPALAVAAALGAEPGPGKPAASFEGADTMLRPAGYREWVFVGSGLGMTYGPNPRPADALAMFDNVYVPRRFYRAFLETGRWPEGTILAMEVRSSAAHELLANRGVVQGDATAMEALVKDSQRFSDTGWGFFVFGVGENARRTARRTARWYLAQLPVRRRERMCPSRSSIDRKTLRSLKSTYTGRGELTHPSG